MKVIKNNGQITKIKAKDLERPEKTERFDSTIDERDRTYQGRKASPRFNEYR